MTKSKLFWPSEPKLESAARKECCEATRPVFQRRLRELGIEGDFEAAFEEAYVPLALWLAGHGTGDRPLIVGVNGGQGSGKSTLSDLAALILREGLSRTVAVFSIDDIYLTLAERRQLASEQHSLLATRGVPGTHDVDLGHRLLDRLGRATPESRTPIPSFDKSIDDRRPDSQWPVFAGRPDVILFEGWCVGARPQPPEALDEPINDLERQQDSDGRWRRYVNRRLERDYRSLFGRLDLLVMLRVPSMEKIVEWRSLQERKLIEAVGEATATMGSDEVRAFIMHYERVTRFALEEMPSRADLCLDIDDDHQISAIRAPAARGSI
jgi:D-glycerate 3-kinase